MNHVGFMENALAESGTQYRRKPLMARSNVTAILMDLPTYKAYCASRASSD